MNLLDPILILLIAAVVIWEGFRGFGRACFDGLALYAALWLTSTLYLPLAHTLPAGNNPAQMQAVAFGASFVVLCIIALVVSYYIWDTIQLNLGMGDKILGIVAGLAVALILAHGLVRTIDISAQNSDTPSVVASSNIGEQVLNFDSFHSTMETMAAFTGGRRNVAVN